MFCPPLGGGVCRGHAHYLLWLQAPQRWLFCSLCVFRPELVPAAHAHSLRVGLLEGRCVGANVTAPPPRVPGPSLSHVYSVNSCFFRPLENIYIVILKSHIL